MSVEINWDWFVSSISWDEANVEAAFSAEFCFVIGSCETDSDALNIIDDMYLGFFRFFSGDFIEKFNGFAWFLLYIKAERFGCDSKVERVGTECQ